VHSYVVCVCERPEKHNKTTHEQSREVLFVRVFLCAQFHITDIRVCDVYMRAVCVCVCTCVCTCHCVFNRLLCVWCWCAKEEVKRSGFNFSVNGRKMEIVILHII